MNTPRVLLYFINLVFGLIEIIIGLRIILKLFGANPNTPFVNWVYEVSRSLLFPFQGIFPSPVLNGGFILEMSALVALLVYALIAYLISEVVTFISFQSVSYYSKTERTKIVEEEPSKTRNP